MVSAFVRLVVALVGALGLAAAAGCTEPAPIEGAACNGDHVCPGGYGCTGGACRRLKGGPIERCQDDGGCPIGRCLVEAGFCVQCLEDRDCAQSACLTDIYQCGCRANADCATGRCNLATAACLSCYADEQCDSGECNRDTGMCRRVGDGPVGGDASEGGAP